MILEGEGRERGVVGKADLGMRGGFGVNALRSDEGPGRPDRMRGGFGVQLLRSDEKRGRPTWSDTDPDPPQYRQFLLVPSHVQGFICSQN